MDNDFDTDYAYLMLKYGDIVPVLIWKLMQESITLNKNDDYNDEVSDCVSFVEKYNLELKQIKEPKSNELVNMFCDLLLLAYNKGKK